MQYFHGKDILLSKGSSSNAAIKPKAIAVATEGAKGEGWKWELAHNFSNSHFEGAMHRDRYCWGVAVKGHRRWANARL